MELFYVCFLVVSFTFSNKTPSTSVVGENAAMLFFCDAPEMNCEI